jgi:hypothetical protein
VTSAEARRCPPRPLMHVMPVIFRVISANLDRLAVCDDRSLLCMLGIGA